MIHEVVQGECLSRIAKSYGLPSWKTIYNHPNNADFRQLRPNPNIIYPGDRLFIPEIRPKTENCSTDQVHPFRVVLDKTWLRIVTKDWEFKPIAGQKYVLEVDGRKYEGVTSQDGLVEHRIRATADQGKLTVFVQHEDWTEDYTWEFYLGRVDPITTVSGVQERLKNLSFDCGPVDGIMGPLTKAAVREFQKKFNLKVDGIVGPQTRGRLEQEHGS